jgi:adenylate cyclase
VNEAARLSDVAKTAPGYVVASGRAVDTATSDEASEWTVRDEITLRGRSEVTRLAVPAE